MSKFASMAFAALAAVAAFAGSQDDVVAYFKTSGPDKYADGTAVLPGEFYALVWASGSNPCHGFNADGTVARPDVNEVLAMCPAAAAMPDGTGYRCPKKSVELSTSKVASLGEGTLHVVVMDTRKADGTLSGYYEDASGAKVPNMVKGFFTTSSVSVAGAFVASTCKIGSPVVIDTKSAVPADAPMPVITGVAMRDGADGGEFVITVRNTAPYLSYVAAGVSADGKSASSAGSTAADGKSSASDEIEIVVPASGNGGLFKVTRQ